MLIEIIPCFIKMPCVKNRFVYAIPNHRSINRYANEILFCCILLLRTFSFSWHYCQSITFHWLLPSCCNRFNQSNQSVLLSAKCIRLLHIHSHYIHISNCICVSIFVFILYTSQFEFSSVENGVCSS